MKCLCRSSASMSYRRKRVTVGSLRLSPLRSSGLCTLRCSSRRCSGFGTTRCGSLRCSGLCTMEDGKLAEKEDEEESKQVSVDEETHTHFDLVSKVMWVIKLQVMEEFNKMTIAEMMGKKGSLVLFAWAHTLAQVVAQVPEILQMRQAKDGCHGANSLMDFIVLEACGSAFGWSRFLGYMQKKQMVVVSDEEITINSRAGPGDLLMHGQLRGGMINQSDEEVLRAFRCMQNNNENDEAMRDWVVNKRTKPNSSAGFSETAEQVEGREKGQSYRPMVARSSPLVQHVVVFVVVDIATDLPHCRRGRTRR